MRRSTRGGPARPATSPNGHCTLLGLHSSVCLSTVAPGTWERPASRTPPVSTPSQLVAPGTWDRPASRTPPVSTPSQLHAAARPQTWLSRGHSVPCPACPVTGSHANVVTWCHATHNGAPGVWDRPASRTPPVSTPSQLHAAARPQTWLSRGHSVPCPACPVPCPACPVTGSHASATEPMQRG